MQAADYIARLLRREGVTHVFEVVGGMIALMIDAIHRDGRIRLVSMHHEQAAAFAAEGTARMTGVPAVAMATSGPGALNLLTGIGSCHFDSTPAVFITGQVNRHELKGERAIRQLGFQETDIVAAAAPITKAAWRVHDPALLPGVLAEAFSLARSGRPGPVLLDIPMDVQRAEVKDGPLRRPSTPAGAPLTDAAGEVVAALHRASRPLILLGGGVRASESVARVRRLVELLGVPAVNSLMAVDVLPADQPLRGGMIGTYGNRWANAALGTADCLLVLGSRLDIRQTGADTDAFKGDRPIYHVDCDAAELNNRVAGCVGIVSDLKEFLAPALSHAELAGRVGCEAWLASIADERLRWPDTAEQRGISGINPNELMHRLAGPAAAYVTDVGQHQMWAAQSIPVRSEQRFVTSGGMGAMGSGLPLAIGAALASPGRPVVLIAGDGGFQLNIQELQTIARNRLPVKLVILNNQSHGMVRQFQDSYFEGRHPSTRWGYSAPSFTAIAAAYGIRSRSIEQPDELDEAVEELWREPDAAFLLEVSIDPAANVYPKIAFGRPITEMEPLAQSVGLGMTAEGT